MKKRFFLGLFSFLVFIPTARSPAQGLRKTWTLVWSDEFNGSRLDESKWVYEVRGPGWVNNEAQNYTGGRPENARVEGGNLIIEGRRDWFQGHEYSSARLKTERRASWKYGRVEARIKVPGGRGTWPAFWMMPDDCSRGWPACGEIDIMEHVGYDGDNFHSTTHTAAHNWMKGNQKQGTKHVPWGTNDFHVYAVDWLPDRLEFSVDGQYFHTVWNENWGDDVWPFNKNFYVILNLAIGGSWGGAQGLDPNIWPRQLLVDYVRVYQEGESAAPLKVYRNCGYDGVQSTLAIGRYTLAELNALGINNDDISSLRVSAGYRVTLYEHDNFQGLATVRTEDQGCLESEWNDKASSVLVEATAQTVAAYRDCDFTGPAFTLPIGQHTAADLQALGINNDAISSLMVQEGYRVTLYEHDNFQGQATVRTSDQSCLGEEWNDRASSVVVEALSQTALFYRDCDFKGPAVDLPIGRYTVADLIARGIRNDDLSSLKVQEGHRVTLYENANFDGPSTVRTTDQSCLGDEWNDRASSVVVEAL